MSVAQFDWSKPCAFDPAHKELFHKRAHVILRETVRYHLGWEPVRDYDLRHNKAGIAVSGEITLHHERVYVQALQSAVGHGMGIIMRTCQGRRDFTGGSNRFYPLSYLNQPALVAKLILQTLIYSKSERS